MELLFLLCIRLCHYSDRCRLTEGNLHPLQSVAEEKQRLFFSFFFCQCEEGANEWGVVWVDVALEDLLLRELSDDVAHSAWRDKDE